MGLTLFLCSCSLPGPEGTSALNLPSGPPGDTTLSFSLGQTSSTVATLPATLPLTGICTVGSKFVGNQVRVNFLVQSNQQSVIRLYNNACTNGQLNILLAFSGLTVASQDVIQLSIQLFGVLPNQSLTPSPNTQTYNLMVGSSTNGSCGNRANGEVWTVVGPVTQRSVACVAPTTGTAIQNIQSTSTYQCQNGQISKTQADIITILSTDTSTCVAPTTSAQYINGSGRHEHGLVMAHDVTWGWVTFKNTGTTTWTTANTKVKCRATNGGLNPLITEGFKVDADNNEVASDTAPGGQSEYRIIMWPLDTPEQSPVCNAITGLAYQCWMEKDGVPIKIAGSGDTATSSILTFSQQNRCYPKTFGSFTNYCTTTSFIGSFSSPARTDSFANTTTDCQVVAFRATKEACNSSSSVTDVAVTYGDTRGIISQTTKTFSCDRIR